MGQCACCEKKASTSRSLSGRNDPTGQSAGMGGTSSAPPLHSRTSAGGQTRPSLTCDIRDLILETLSVIKTLNVQGDQEPPAAMLKLNILADKSMGWLLIIQMMVEIVPAENPLGPAVITLFLDESPLPTKETVVKLLYYFNLNADRAENKSRPPIWHRNVCIVLGCIAEKLAGPNSVATFKDETLEYLVANLTPSRDPNVVLFSLIALEKYAQTSENKAAITKRLKAFGAHPLKILELWFVSENYVEHQVGFCAQWTLDNLFLTGDRAYTYTTINTANINAMLNHNDVSEYLKISPDGLEARCDASSFESVRCTFQVTHGVWYYEATVATPGVMQIGWATKNSKFLNHEGYGIGDDEYSVAYDGCRQLIWHNAGSQPHSHPPWEPGDVLGTLLDLDQCQLFFYLNGVPLPISGHDIFRHAKGAGFFAAASFMSFQQCRFNFGHNPFTFPPAKRTFASFNDFAHLTEEERIILPRHKKLELLRQQSTQEGACTVCFAEPGVVTLKPCNHGGICQLCSDMLEYCPFCRASIDDRITAKIDAKFEFPRLDTNAESDAPTPADFPTLQASNS